MNKLLILYFFISLCVLLSKKLVKAFNCPNHKNCLCSYQVHNINKYNVWKGHVIECSNDLKIEVDNYHESHQIICNSSKPGWPDYFLDLKLEIGKCTNLKLQNCGAPSTLRFDNHSDEAAAERFKTVLGITTTQTISFESLQGQLSNKELVPYSDLKEVFISETDVENLGEEFFSHSPSLGRLLLVNIRGDLANFINRTNLKSFTNIKVLYLEGNDTIDLNSEVLQDLPHLKTLNVWDNYLENLSGDTFKRFENLTTLSLTANKSLSLPEKLFHYAPDLCFIKITFNNKNIAPLPSDLLHNLRLLFTLHLVGVGIAEIGEDFFSNCKDLNQLHLDLNHLTTLPVDLFKNLTKLEDLTLGYNNLKNLPDGLFRDLRSLRVLDLSHNHLHYVEGGMFKGLSSLEYLDMRNNDLRKIADYTFSSLRALKQINLNRNKLTLEPRSPNEISILGLSMVSHIDLGNNNISHMIPLEDLNNIKRVNLEKNFIEEIELETFQFLTTGNTVDLNLSYNNITHIKTCPYNNSEQNSRPRVMMDITGNPIQCDCQAYDFFHFVDSDKRQHKRFHFTMDKIFCFDNIPIKNLHHQFYVCRYEANNNSATDSCALGGICNCWFRPYDQTLIVDCANKNLTRFSEILSTENATRLELNLYNNSLREYPSIMNSPFDKLQVLNISYNQISNVNEIISLTNLQVIDLSNNNLTEINEEILDLWTNLPGIRLYLKNNPWTCDCSPRSSELLSFIRSKASMISESEKVLCHGTNQPITNFLCPTFETSEIILYWFILLLVVSFVSIAIMLYTVYQNEIKVWLYSRNLCLWWVSEEKIDEDKLYDVFISFSHKDEEFVMNELVNKLESEPNSYELCIHVRDWLAGEWICTQIEKSVRESRRTIIVLSKNFVASEWGRMEFLAAYHRTQNEKRNRLIIIMYEELDPTTALYPELKTYLKTHTYIKWGDPWFWEKLIYALPHKSRRTA